MKKSIATYLAFFSLLFMGVSCTSDDNEIVSVGTPYALISSFSIDNIRLPFHSFTVEGKDTIIEKVVSGDAFKFVVDQRAREIYNIDSLTYGTKINKVATTLSYSGVPYCYNAEAGDYVYYYSVDSLDFTTPLRVRITSTDETYENFYTIRINVHQVDPELLVWNTFAMNEAVAGFAPVRLVEKGGALYLFCENENGAPFVAVATAQGALDWVVTPIAVSGADLSSVMAFDNAFYMLAGGVLYSSPDATAWSVAADGLDIVSLLAVSEEEGKMWAATADEILYTTDGVSFVVSEPMPQNFPLYGCSSASYPLATNGKIFRTMLIGYADDAKSGDVQVWSKLSTEEQWSAYEQPNDKYKCPSLPGLQVLHYDNTLFAIGGATVVDEKPVQPFGAFFVSKDNGIAWRLCKDYNLKLPMELNGKDLPFATTVTADDYMWIITPEAAWRGKINRLSF